MYDHDEDQIDEWHRGYALATADRPDLTAFGALWPLAYLAVAQPERAVGDADALAALRPGQPPYVTLADGHDGRPRFTVAVVERPLSLGEILPILQSLGLEVLTEQPYQIVRPDGEPCWLYDFLLEPPTGLDGDLARRLEDAFRAVWAGQAETDPFNRLVTVAGLTWREAGILRGYGQYLHQLGTPWGRTFTALTLADHPAIARGLADLFDLRFRPRAGLDTATRQERLRSNLETAVDEAVENLTADRLLRSYLALITATVRTNAYRSDSPADCAIAVKLDPAGLELMPAPRPRFEVWVSSPRLEGIHLRFGPVARGGLRWSDRHEDLRTEILGLATAQVAKNAVIVPTGAKGGFVLKRQRSAKATASEVEAGYREFVSALLDVHDSIDPSTSRPDPSPATIAYEGGDAYLVVAADKGTASLSDTANQIAQERGFWLGDAFASGGSTGYDHKAMGITARGAWCSVTRHFAELGLNPDTDTVTAVGIGDMSGDVFGNGMLLSPRLKLVAAFDHRHIFLDPDPDPETAVAERARLFAEPRSSWADYRPQLISTGGGVYSRAAKSVPITPQVRAALDLPGAITRLTPASLISAVLAAPVDLLWNGGVGTYVKASTEQHSDVADRVNDGLRINATQVRARVVGEGGNLGFTQRARIEYAIAGGRINTDALDNSAGVGCSDREVNIKIALQELSRQGMTEPARVALLEAMTDQVADLVLAENRTQNELLGQSRQFAHDDIALHARLINDLERRRGLDRGHLALPSAAEITARRHGGKGLTSPELAVLSAQVKLDCRDILLAGSIPDDPAVQHFLHDYFPTQLSQRHPDAIQRHPLRREIIATEIVNTVVDRAGLGWVHRIMENTTASAEDAVRAYLITETVFDLPRLWHQIRAAAVTTTVTGELIWETTRTLDRVSRWLLQHRPQPLDISGEIARLRPTIADLSDAVPQWNHGTDHIDYRHRLDPVVAAGAPPELAETVFGLLERFCLLDITEIARETNQPTRRVAELYYLVKEHRRIDRLLTGVSGLPRTDRWSALARLGLRDDLYESVRIIAATIATTSPPDSQPHQALRDWERRVGARLEKIEAVVDASRSGHDLANLAVAARQIRTLALLTTNANQQP